MSITPMDLDSSLDDLIKKRKTNKPNKPNNNNHKGHNAGKKQQQQQHKSRPSIQVQSKAKVTKPQRHSGINARLSTAPASKIAVSGPLFTSKNQPQKEQQRKVADPSQIIITKAIAPGSIQSRIGNNNNRVNNNNNKKSPSIENVSLLGGRLGGKRGEQERVETKIYQQRPSTATSSPVVSNFSIRGRSNTVSPSQGLSIRGESGPTLVLVTGLDPGTNEDDVKVAFDFLGNILRCDVLRDRHGRSFGEAEIEFSTKSAALDCIAQLDNQMADGRPLRVILRENKPKKPVYSPKPIQSVISTPSYNSSGKMYADQITPRYDIRRQ